MARKSATKEVSDANPGVTPKSRLRKIYAEKVAPQLQEEFKFSSKMQVPRMLKIVVNMGTGIDEKELEGAMRDMRAVTGQQPTATVARKSVSNFKLREGMKIGCRVTLRGERMYHFFDKLCPASATSKASAPSRLMAEATTRSASKSSWYSRKLITIRSTRSAGWTSRL